MGRHKQVLTETEIAERKAKWFGPARNQKRREAYAANKAFREQEQERARVRNRDPGYENPWTELQANLGKAVSFGKLRDVTMPDGTITPMICLTTEEVARMMGRKTHMIFRWRPLGKFPNGVLYHKDPNVTGSPSQVYTPGEIDALMNVLAEHVAKVAYYHSNHTETRDKLFAAVAAVRQKEGLPHDADTIPQPAAA